MEKGIVTWFDDIKGYGFIKGENEDSSFVHYSNILMDGHKTLEANQKVEYDKQPNDKGTIAMNVKVIEE